MEIPAFIDMGFDEQWLLTNDQVEYFFKHAEPPTLTEAALEQIYAETGYDHVWTKSVINLTLIENSNGFSVVKNASDNFKTGEQTHLHMFPQFEGLSKYFKRILTLDLSYISEQVLLHQDAYVDSMDHGMCLKIFPHGSVEDFTMVRLNGHDNPDYTRQRGLTKTSNVFLIDNAMHGHYTPPNPKPFIVLFVNGEFQDGYRKDDLASIGISHYV